jgi:hypothetical protein
VGKARILRHDAKEVRLRWLGALLLMTAVAAAGYLTFRYYGVRAGWWPTLLPFSGFKAVLQSASSGMHSAITRVLALIGV